MRCMRGVTIIRPKIYAKAQVVDLYGLIQCVIKRTFLETVSKCLLRKEIWLSV